MDSGGVVGVRATPASQPPVWIRSSVRCRCVTTSGWTEILTTPASMKDGIRLSGFVTWRWASMGRFTAAASEAATAGPTVRLGTKWLSIASKCTSAAPPLSALRTSSASSEKSAARIEGAPTTLSPSLPKNVKRSASQAEYSERTILQKGPQENSSELLEVHGVKIVPLAGCLYRSKAGQAFERSGQP